MEFNGATGDSVLFEADDGQTYEVEVNKGQERTRICGEGWEKFIIENDLIGGEYVCFSLKGPVPRFRIVYVSVPTKADLAFESAYFSQRTKLNEDETANIFDILPPTKSYMGVPSVHRLTMTNIVKHVMVCFLVFISLLFCVHQ